MKAKKNKDKSYDKWREDKIIAIKNAHDCSFAEATIIFLLQDISYKLSIYYNK